jgi:glycosyltransferase involved in cell wall biosynthesis
LVVTLHGGIVGDPLYGGMPLGSPVVKNILENDVAAITTYSKEILETLEKLGFAQKSHLITNFVDVPSFKNPNTPNAIHDPTIIYVGRLEPVQTPELVIKAFKQVNEQFPNAKLTIVGYGRLYEYLQNLIRELHLEGSVTMTGKQTDVRKYLWSSDVFVATNFGYIATLEAMSAGLPVVAPNFGILKETVKHEYNGLLVEEHDVNQVAAALIRLIKDEEFRKTLSRNAFESVKNYDIRVIAPKMADVYQSVVKN